MATMRTVTRLAANPTPTITAKATTVESVSLRPAVKRQLLTELRAYAELHAQAAALKHAMEKHKTRIGEIRAATGSTAIEIEGFKIAEVRGVRSVFNKDKFVAMGGSLQMYTDACETKPNKPYERITVPGEGGDD